jgi:UDP-GlcNAc:undecaprenyl-phosphate GlcNAc-1-phosphate transferase
MSNYPFGTLRPIQGIFFGGSLILLLGLVDDIVSGGLSFKEKFAIQFIASAILLFYDIQLHFIHPRWLAFALTVTWVTGVMNAMNIIDIMDGLAGGIAFIAALAFLFISLPTEQIYVNMTAAVLAGACLGFLPYNFSKKRKMFMGDTGSLFIGYVLAALSLGTEYSLEHNAGVIAPILILGVPLYDTFFVMLIRYRKGLSPFLGSRDHFALRLEKMGFTRVQIVWIAIVTSVVLSFSAWLTTRIWFWYAVALYTLIFGISWFLGLWLAKVQIDLPSPKAKPHERQT